MHLKISNTPATIADRRRREKVIAAVSCHSADEAEKLYAFLKISLVDINNWNEFRFGNAFHTKLTDLTGRTVSRFARAGDLFKIMLPSRQAATRLYDWWEIKTIEEKLYGQTEIFFITIWPAVTPEANVPDPSQFFRPGGKVTLFVIRDERKIELQEHNFGKTGGYQFFGLKERLRHVFTAFVAGSGLYETQWSGLLKSILKVGLARMKVSGG